jgi:hypothetical protein
MFTAKLLAEASQQAPTLLSLPPKSSITTPQQTNPIKQKLQYIYQPQHLRRMLPHE